MKIKTLALAIILITLGLFSCKKCITCTDTTGQSSQDYCYTHTVDKNNFELEYTQQGGSCVPKP